jgi:hypothetical protein
LWIGRHWNINSYFACFSVNWLLWDDCLLQHLPGVCRSDAILSVRMLNSAVVFWLGVFPSCKFWSTGAVVINLSAILVLFIARLVYCLLQLSVAWLAGWEADVMLNNIISSFSSRQRWCLFALRTGGHFGLLSQAFVRTGNVFLCVVSSRDCRVTVIRCIIIVCGTIIGNFIFCWTTVRWYISYTSHAGPFAVCAYCIQLMA